MRLRLRILAGLATFIVGIVVIAFIGAIRRPGPSRTPAITLVRLHAAHLHEGEFTATTVRTDVTIAGRQYLELPLYVVRSAGKVQVLWARGTQFDCALEPYSRASAPISPTITAKPAFDDRCNGSVYAIDGTCIAGPCPSGLDSFKVVERKGVQYADLNTLIPGAPVSREP